MHNKGFATQVLCYFLLLLRTLFASTENARFSATPATSDCRSTCHTECVPHSTCWKVGLGWSGVEWIDFRSPFCTCTWPAPFPFALFLFAAVLLLGRLYEILIDLFPHLHPFPLQWYKVQSASGKWNHMTNRRASGATHCKTTNNCNISNNSNNSNKMTNCQSSVFIVVGTLFSILAAAQSAPVSTTTQAEVSLCANN